MALVRLLFGRPAQAQDTARCKPLASNLTPLPLRWPLSRQHSGTHAVLRAMPVPVVQ
jgi:hypothetical protein